MINAIQDIPNKFHSEPSWCPAKTLLIACCVWMWIYQTVPEYGPSGLRLCPPGLKESVIKACGETWPDGIQAEVVSQFQSEWTWQRPC